MRLTSNNKIVRIIGNSMEPLLYNGDIAFTVPRDTYNVGDMVAFSYIIDGVEKRLLHRIVGRDGSYFICKGDNSLGFERVIGDAIMGKVTTVIRKGEKVDINIPEEAMRNFCYMSKMSGDEWRGGNIRVAQALGKRCYINMLKICLELKKNNRRD